MTGTDIKAEKSQIRRTLHQQRRALAPKASDEAGKQLLAHLEKAPFTKLKPHSNIAFFNTHKDEIDPSYVAAYLERRGHHLCLPVIRPQDDHMVFRHHRFGHNGTLERGRFGISQPKSTCSMVQPDLVLVPLLGMDKKGTRLGYGKGFYDQALTQLPDAIFVGVGYDFQLVRHIPAEPHDVAVHYMMTPSALVKA